MKSIPKAYTLQFIDFTVLANTAETTAFQQKIRFDGIFFLKTLA